MAKASKSQVSGHVGERAADPLHRAWVDAKTLGDAAYTFTSVVPFRAAWIRFSGSGAIRGRPSRLRDVRVRANLASLDPLAQSTVYG